MRGGHGIALIVNALAYTAKRVEKGGEGFGDAAEVVYADGGVGAPGGDGEGHGHAVVVRGGIFTALQQMTVQEAALDGLTGDGEGVAAGGGLHAHPGEHVQNRNAPVAFLTCQSLESLNITASVAEGGEHGDNREQVGAVVEVGVEGAERGLLGGDQAAVALRGVRL